MKKTGTLFTSASTAILLAVISLTLSVACAPSQQNDLTTEVSGDTPAYKQELSTESFQTRGSLERSSIVKTRSLQKATLKPEEQSQTSAVDSQRPISVELPRPPKIRLPWKMPKFLESVDSELVDKAKALKSDLLSKQTESQSLTEADVPAPTKIDLAGPLRGFYTDRKRFYVVDMNLKHGDSAEWTGDANFYRLISRRDSASLDENPLKQGTVVAKVDSSGMIRIETSFRKERGGRKYVDERIVFSGVMAKSPNRVAGTVHRSNPNRSTKEYELGYGFVFAQDPADAEKLVAKICDAEVAAYKFRYGVHSKRNWTVKNDPAISKAILDWADKFSEEYPTVDLRHTQTQILFPMVANLFSDNHFKKHFGKTFDEFSAVRSQEISYMINAGSRGRLGAGYQQAFKQISFMGSLFSTGGSSDRIQTLTFIWPRREIRRWFDQQIDTGRKSEVSVPFKFNLESARRVASRSIASREREHETLERKRAAALLAETGEEIMKLIPNVAEAFVAQQIKATKELGQIKRLRDWQRELKATFGVDLEDASQEKRLQQAVNHRIDWLIRENLAGYIDRLSSLPNRLNSAQSVEKIHQEIRFSFFGDSGMRNPLVKETLEYAGRLKASLVANHLDQVGREINAIETHRELRSYTQSLTNLSMDKQPEASKRIWAMKDARTIAIDKEARMAFYSPLEVSLMDQSETIRVVPNDIPPPTAEEIKLALVREHNDAHLYSRISAPDTYEFAVFILNMPFAKIQIQIQEVEVSNQPVKNADGSYTVKFRYSGRKQHLFLERDGFLTNMQNAIADIEAGIPTEVQEETFALTPNGWRSPTIRRALSTSALVVKGKAVKAAGFQPDERFKSFLESEFPKRKR